MTLFDPADYIDPALAVTPAIVACGNRGPDTAWLHPNRLAFVRATRPRCNRPEAHGGKHRRYRDDGELVAEWAIQP